MVPIHPFTVLTRPRVFVKEEWDRYFSEGRVNVEGTSSLTPSIMFFLHPLYFPISSSCIVFTSAPRTPS
jgi:hypothetical protein